MNFKKFAAIFRDCANVRIEYEIIGNHLYVMTPYMACIIANTKTLPKALESMAKQNTEPGETKKKILSLMDGVNFDYAMNTQMTFQRHEDYAPCVILQGTDKTGKPYPVLVNQEYYSLVPRNPDAIMTCGRTGVVMVTASGDVFLIMPIRCSQQTLIHILGTVQAFCLEVTVAESGLPAPYVKVDDVAQMLSNIGTQGPPCGFNHEEAWDRAIYDANQELQKLPMKMLYANVPDRPVVVMGNGGERARMEKAVTEAFRNRESHPEESATTITNGYRCHKCVNEHLCVTKRPNCNDFVRDAPDGGFYG